MATILRGEGNHLTDPGDRFNVSGKIRTYRVPVDANLIRALDLMVLTIRTHDKHNPYNLVAMTEGGRIMAQDKGYTEKAALDGLRRQIEE
jgi:hypothetical protein